MAAVNVIEHYIDITPDVCGGRPRITGTRITVADVALMRLKMNLSLEEISGTHDLPLGAVPRFHLDEQVNPAVALALRRYGIDVTTTVQAGLRSVSDDIQWNYAQRDGRIIVTHDADFPRRASNSPDHAGIAYYRKDTRTIRQIVDGLILIYEVLTAEEMYNHIEYL